MASVTIRFSVLLIALGLLFYYVTHQVSLTALIPTFFGIVLLVLGLLARTENTKQRMLVMHIAVTVALLGFIFPAARVVMGWVKAHAFGLTSMAVREELLMAIICLVYVYLCVRSFIAARKARLA